MYRLRVARDVDCVARYRVLFPWQPVWVLIRARGGWSPRPVGAVRLGSVRLGFAGTSDRFSINVSLFIDRVARRRRPTKCEIDPS